MLVLDAEPFAALTRERGRRFEEVRASLRAAHRLRREVLVPAVVLAELYRGRNNTQLVDACLSRETGVSVVSTDRRFARLVGGVLSAARATSKDLAGAHVVAAAVGAGGGVVLTVDPSDVGRLSAAYPNVTVATV